jgi:hypothetical protein
MLSFRVFEYACVSDRLRNSYFLTGLLLDCSKSRHKSFFMLTLKWRTGLVAGTAILVILMTPSCRKIDYNYRHAPDPSVRFFNIPPGTMPIVQRIAEKMKELNTKEPFIQKLVSRSGFPKWEKSLAYLDSGPSKNFGGGEDTVVFIPFLTDSLNQVTASLTCYANEDSIYLRMFNGDEYANYGMDFDMDRISAERVTLQLMMMETVALGHDSFQVNDGKLFLHDSFKMNNARAGTAKIKIEYGCFPEQGTNPGCESGRRRHNKSNIVILGSGPSCWSVRVNCIEEGALRAESLAAPVYLEVCTEVTSWRDEVSFGPHAVFGQMSSGGSGGVGTMFNNSPCYSLIPEECGIRPFGWNPIYVSTGGSFDPNAADSVRVDNEILDSFPCVYYLIRDSLYNINRVVQTTMQDFFALNMKNHVYFEINWALNCNSPFNAYTKPHGVRSVVGGIVHWTDTIQLNPCFLRIASKEKIIQVLLHEPVHAFISWCIKEYKRTTPWGAGEVDSNFLKRHFCIYWEALNAKPYEHETDHDIMIHNYLRYFSNIIYQYGNKNATPTLRRWVADNLAATGLHLTSAWGNAPGATDTCAIYGIDYWSRYHKEGAAPSGTLSLPGCRTFTTSFRDSIQMQRGDSCL